MARLRFALFGAGFWSNYQLPGWLESGQVDCVAVCDPTLEKAQALARLCDDAHSYTSADTLFAQETLDFVDLCTPVETHVPLAKMAADRGIHVVCQKPLAPSLDEAAELVAYCEQKGVMLLVNENWRWQDPLRRLKAHLNTGTIGTPFRARIDYRNSFPVFDNQPFLKTLPQFIIADMGTHILDVARYLFGEAASLDCHIQTIHQDIRGEDVATVMLRMVSGVTVIVEMSYASPREHDRFPETYVEIEGNQGFLELGPDFWIRETSRHGTQAQRVVPQHYAWANPQYDVIHTSIVTCQTHLAQALAGLVPAETTGRDNLKTLQLVYKAYESAEREQRVFL